MLLILGLFALPAGTVELYQESPWLRDDVTAGRLPPVAERLPAEPEVVGLKAEGKERGFAVDVVPVFEDHGRPVSSGPIRDALTAGRIDEANEYLGYPWFEVVAAGPATDPER